MKNFIFVLGGSGYVGSQIVEKIKIHNIYLIKKNT
jgi:hypothetical protein